MTNWYKKLLFMMKHIKHINEGWIEKIIPKRPKPVITRITEAVDRIFNEKIQHPLIYKIVAQEVREDEDHKDTCLVRVLTRLYDDFGDGLTYLFSINLNKGVIHFKVLGYSGYHTKDFYSFDEVNYPIGYEEELDEIIETFANKAKPFIEKMLKLDDE